MSIKTHVNKTTLKLQNFYKIYMISISCLESKLLNNNNWYGRFQLAPFQKGEGLTIANALRRTLLAEKSNFFITWVDFYNAEIPYSVLTGMRESVFDILLNLKQVIFTSDTIIPDNNYFFKSLSNNNFRTKKNKILGQKFYFGHRGCPDSGKQRDGSDLKQAVWCESWDPKKFKKNELREAFKISNNLVLPITKKRQISKILKLQNFKNQKIHLKSQNLFCQNQILGKTIHSEDETCLVPLKIFGQSNNLKKQYVDLSSTGKQKVLKKMDHNPYIGYICAKGPAIIYAKNLKLPKGLKCVDPDKYIVTLADDGLFYLRFALTTEIQPEPLLNVSNLSISINQGINFNKVKLETDPQTLFNKEIKSCFGVPPWQQSEFSYPYIQNKSGFAYDFKGSQAAPCERWDPKQLNQQFLNNNQIYFLDNSYQQKYYDSKINKISSKPIYRGSLNLAKLLYPLSSADPRSITNHKFKTGGYSSVNAKKKNFESHLELDHSQMWPNYYTKSLINRQRLVLTNDSIKQFDFQNTSITASIQKTCLLNIQIKHYYYKCGRFDRFLFDLIKTFKPIIKSTYYDKSLLKNLFCGNQNQSILGKWLLNKPVYPSYSCFFGGPSNFFEGQTESASSGGKKLFERQKSNSQLINYKSYLFSFIQDSCFPVGESKVFQHSDLKRVNYQSRNTFRFYPIVSSQVNGQTKPHFFFQKQKWVKSFIKFWPKPNLESFFSKKLSQGRINKLLNISRLKSTINLFSFKVKSQAKYPSTILVSPHFIGHRDTAQVSNGRKRLHAKNETQNFYRHVFEPYLPNFDSYLLNEFSPPAKIFKSIKTNSIYDYLQKLNTSKAVILNFLVSSKNVNPVKKYSNSFPTNQSTPNKESFDIKFKHNDLWVSNLYEPYIEKFLNVCVSFQCSKNYILEFLKNKDTTSESDILQSNCSSVFNLIPSLWSVSLKNTFNDSLFRSNFIYSQKFITKIKLLRQCLFLPIDQNHESIILLLKKKTFIFPWVTNAFWVRQLKLLKLLFSLNQNEKSVSTHDNYLRQFYYLGQNAPKPLDGFGAHFNDLEDGKQGYDYGSPNISPAAPSERWDSNKYLSLYRFSLSTSLRVKSFISIGQVSYKPIWVFPYQFKQNLDKLTSALDLGHGKETQIIKTNFPYLLKNIQTTFKPISNNNVVLKPTYLNIEQIIYILKQTTKFRKNQRINPIFWRDSHIDKSTLELSFNRLNHKNYYPYRFKKSPLAVSQFNLFKTFNKCLLNNFFKTSLKKVFLDSQQIGVLYSGASFLYNFFYEPDMHSFLLCTKKERNRVFAFAKTRMPKNNENKQITHPNFQYFQKPMLKKNSEDMSRETKFHIWALGKNFVFKNHFSSTTLNNPKTMAKPISRLSRFSKSSIIKYYNTHNFSYSSKFFLILPENLFGFFKQSIYFKQSFKKAMQEKLKTSHFFPLFSTVCNSKINNLQSEPYNINLYNSKISFNLRYTYPFKYTIFETHLPFFNISEKNCYPSQNSSPLSDSRQSSFHDFFFELNAITSYIMSSSLKKKSGAAWDSLKRQEEFNQKRNKNHQTINDFKNHKPVNNFLPLVGSKIFSFLNLDSIQYNESFKIYTSFAYTCLKSYESGFSKYQKPKNKYLNFTPLPAKSKSSAKIFLQWFKFLTNDSAFSEKKNKNWILNIEYGKYNHKKPSSYPFLMIPNQGILAKNNNIKLKSLSLIKSFPDFLRTPMSQHGGQYYKLSKLSYLEVFKLFCANNKIRIRKVIFNIVSICLANDSHYIKNLKVPTLLDSKSQWRIMNNRNFNDAFIIIPSAWYLRFYKSVLPTRNSSFTLDIRSSTTNNELKWSHFYPENNTKFSTQNPNENIYQKQFLISKFKRNKYFKNLAINFEDIYYKNFLWNSRKITLRILNNAVLPLVANRKYSISDFIPKKNFQAHRFIKAPMGVDTYFSPKFSIWSYNNLNNIVSVWPSKKFEGPPKNKITNTITRNWLKQLLFSSQFLETDDYQKPPFYSIRSKILGTTDFLCSKTTDPLHKNQQYSASLKNESQQSGFFFNSSVWSLRSKWRPFFTGSLRQENKPGHLEETSFKSALADFPTLRQSKNRENNKVSLMPFPAETGRDASISTSLAMLVYMRAYRQTSASMTGSSTPEKLAFIRRQEWAKKLIQASKFSNSEDISYKNDFKIKLPLINNLWLSSFFCRYSLDTISTKSDFFLQNLITYNNWTPSTNEIEVFQANSKDYKKNLQTPIPGRAKKMQSQNEQSNYDQFNFKLAISSYDKTIKKILKSRDYKSVNFWVPTYHYQWQKAIHFSILGGFNKKFNKKIRSKNQYNDQFFSQYSKNIASQNSMHKPVNSYSTFLVVPESTRLFRSLKRSAVFPSRGSVSKKTSTSIWESPYSIRRFKKYERYFGNPFRRRTGENQFSFYKIVLPTKPYKEFTTKKSSLRVANQQHAIKSWKFIIATAKANIYFCFRYPFFIKNGNLPWQKAKFVFSKKKHWLNRIPVNSKPTIKLNSDNYLFKNKGLLNKPARFFKEPLKNGAALFFGPQKIRVLSSEASLNLFKGLNASLLMTYTQLSSSSNKTHQLPLNSTISFTNKVSEYINIQNNGSYGMIGYFTIKEGLNSIYKVNYIVESQMSTESKSTQLFSFDSNQNNSIISHPNSMKELSVDSHIDKSTWGSPNMKKFENMQAPPAVSLHAKGGTQQNSITTDSLTISNFLNGTYSFVPNKTIVLNSFNELINSQINKSQTENENEYIQIDIWTNGELSPRQALLNAFKKLFELFYNLSKYNCLKPIEI